MLLKKASLLRDVIIGINAPMGRYENYPEKLDVDIEVL